MPHTPQLSAYAPHPLAVDCARVLLKQVDDLAQTDICSHAVEQLKWVKAGVGMWAHCAPAVFGVVGAHGPLP